MILEFQGQKVTVKRSATTILNAKELYLRISLGFGEEFKYTPELVEDVTNGVYVQFIQYLTKRRGLEQDVLPTKLSASS